MHKGHINRYLTTAINADLKEKMVFLGGPRQVGKTTLALSLLENGNEKHPAYLNWDDVPTRKALLRGELPPDEPLIIPIAAKSGWISVMLPHFRPCVQVFLQSPASR